MPVSHEEHGRIPVAVPIVLRGFDQLINLGLGQVLAAAELAVWPAPRGNCSFFGGWRDQLQVRFGHSFRLLAINDCSYNTFYTSSLRSDFGQFTLPLSAAGPEAQGRADNQPRLAPCCR